MQVSNQIEINSPNNIATHPATSKSQLTYKYHSQNLLSRSTLEPKMASNTTLLFTFSLLLALVFSNNYSPCHSARVLLEDTEEEPELPPFPEFPDLPKPELPPLPEFPHDFPKPELPPLPEIPHDFPKPELPPLPEIPHDLPKLELPPLPEIPHLLPEEPKHP